MQTTKTQLSAVEMFQEMMGDRTPSFRNERDSAGNFKRCELLKPTWITTSDSMESSKHCLAGTMF